MTHPDDKGEVMPTEFYVGMELDINEECLGVVTEVTDDSIHIMSESFTGWASKAEISEAIDWWLRQEGEGQARLIGDGRVAVSSMRVRPEPTAHPDDSEPITAAWIRETAPGAVLHRVANTLDIDFQSRADGREEWTLELVVFPKSRLCGVVLQAGDVYAVELPAIRTRGELRRLWKQLTGREWD